MALTADQTAQLYQLLGVPQQGSIRVQLDWTSGSLEEPLTDTIASGTITNLITAITAALAALSSNQETRMGVILTAYIAIDAGSPMRLVEGDGETVNHRKQIRNLRKEAMNILGVYIPETFQQAIERMRANGDR